MDGQRRAAPSPDLEPGSELSPLTVPPADLSGSAKTFWRHAAPEAIAARTLIPSTMVGFRELCQQWAMKEAIAKDIEKVGAASRSADGSLRHYVKLAQRVDSSLARFKLTGFGKPADSGGAKKLSPSPWAQVAGK